MEILMVRPYQFYFNQQTASNNFFQSNINIENANELAIAEFDTMVEKLRAHQIKVNVVQDTKDPSTPDSIFPNNWVSTHTNGTLCLYPMYAENRRAERKSSVIEFLQSNYKIENTLDLTDLEKEGIFLEGTGSMVLDHQNKIAYGCLSERLDKEAFISWCDKMQFKPITFKAVDDKAQPIYHTNVLMCNLPNNTSHHNTSHHITSHNSILPLALQARTGSMREKSGSAYPRYCCTGLGTSSTIVCISPFSSCFLSLPLLSFFFYSFQFSLPSLPFFPSLSSASSLPL